MTTKRQTKPKAGISVWGRWALYLAVAAIWLSGAVWVCEKFFGLGEGEFGSPTMALAMKTHGAAAMVFLVVFGVLFSHIQAGWKTKRNRLLGIALIGVIVFLAASGWLLYYSGDEAWRNVSSMAHWTTGLALPLLLIFHIVRGRKK
jgi:fatty acid desaturase